MSKKETFLLVSLNEEKAKELAQVVSSNTCRKILGSLEEKEATESELSAKLDLPISTVHYNLQQLMKGGLIVVEEFHYSDKGREVNHYKLANKFIIIAPQKTWGLKEKLRKILPALGLVAVTSFVIQATTMFKSGASSLAASSVDMVATASEKLVEEAPNAAMGVVSQAAADGTKTAAPVVVERVVEVSNIWQYAALWILVGGLLAICGYLVFDWYKNRK